MRCARNFAADEIHARDLLDARLDVSQLLRCQDAFEDEGGVRERGQRDIDRGGDIVAIEQGENASFRLRPLLSLDDRVTPLLEHPKEIMVALAQNAPRA